MNHDSEERRRRFGWSIGRKAARRIRARGETDSPWFWLGMFGLIGWSVAIPTVVGVAVGLWLDENVPTSFSWVLSMLVVGLAIGILTAWFWVRQSTADERDDEEVRG
jgi:ATP synthase protein I